MAIDIGAKAIVVSSLSGRTVRMVSRFRVPTDIIGMATNKAVWYKLALSWGVLAVGGAIACLRRGKVELEYSLDAHTIRLTERGRQVKSEELPLKDVNQLKRIGDGMKLKCGRKQARIFCDKVTCERIESMVYAERA